MGNLMEIPNMSITLHTFDKKENETKNWKKTVNENSDQTLFTKPKLFPKNSSKK